MVMEVVERNVLIDTKNWAGYTLKENGSISSMLVYIKEIIKGIVSIAYIIHICCILFIYLNIQKFFAAKNWGRILKVKDYSYHL